jgi:hypothetical protein
MKSSGTAPDPNPNLRGQFDPTMVKKRTPKPQERRKKKEKKTKTKNKKTFSRPSQKYEKATTSTKNAKKHL